MVLKVTLMLLKHYLLQKIIITYDFVPNLTDVRSKSQS